jgi:hypothetical protein
MAKINRENSLREKRLVKQARKDARKLAAAEEKSRAPKVSPDDTAAYALSSEAISSKTAM